MIEITNNRILVIDAALLFDDLPQVPRPPSQLLEFIVDEASSGVAGVEMVRSAILDGRPYAAVFVDMRMPRRSTAKPAPPPLAHCSPAQTRRRLLPSQ